MSDYDSKVHAAAVTLLPGHETHDGSELFYFREFDS
jgi:hypothetical protein